MKEKSEMRDTARPEMTAYERTHGPVWEWFELTYANFLVIHRAQLQSMPAEWQARLVELLEELQAAYAHLDIPGFEVATVRDAYVGELTADEMTLLGITVSESPDGPVYAGRGGRELNSGEHVGIPVEDPVPHYRHAYVAPDEAAIAALRAARRAGADTALIPEPEHS